jgi:hypothetical protein
MNAVWIDEGQDPDYTKLRKYGIDTAYFSIRDQLVVERINAAKDHSFKVGIYFAWNWYPKVLGGAGLADTISNELTILGFKDYSKDGVRILADIEEHDIAGYVVPFFQRWRKHRPNRVTDWTLEGMQGGLFTATDVANISACSILVAPAFYGGNMAPLPHSPIIDLLMAGFQGYQLVGMYDAAALPWRWSGYAFTQGRLP